MKWILLFILWIPFAFSSTEEFSLLLEGIQTRSSNHKRNVYIYLPQGYGEVQGQRYPVLYMHDGQNLYDASRSTYGETWKVTETLNSLISQKLIPPIIVVGIDNTAERTLEYTHDWEPSRKTGGRAQAYLEFITYDLKPFIDHNFATRRGRASTAIMGSSLGGLVSLFAGTRFSETFGLIGSMSPSVWWNNKSILNLIRSSQLPDRVYLDSGTVDGERPDDARLAADTYKASGARHVKLEIQQDAGHNEKFWAQRLPGALRFLFPKN